MTEDAKKPLGRILLKQRAVSQDELDRALADPAKGGAPLATRLTESGAISEVAALKALSEQSGVPGIDLNQVCIRLSDLAIVPRELAQRHKLLPVLVRDDRVFVAMASPTEKKVTDEIEFVTGKHVFPYIALSGPLARVIQVAYDMKDRGETHYVGPACPAEVKKRAGIVEAPVRDSGGFGAALPTPAVPTPAVQARPAPPPAKAAAEPAYVDPFADWADITGNASPPAPGAPPRTEAATPLVVDDAMGRAAADELTDADFGTADRDLSVVTSLPEGSGAVAQPGQRTVLVVDDEIDIRRLLRRVLEDRGYRVLEADRGHTAMRMLKERTPDVLILDAMLPEVHGFEIARRMKGTERFGHVPIVMVSAVYRGWRFAEDLKASYGVDAYIEKPFRVGDVVAAVEKALAGRVSDRAASPPETLNAEAERLLAAGIAAYQAGDIALAIEQLSEGTKKDPVAYRLHFHLGLLYGKNGRIYDAIQALETAINLNGRHFPAIKNLAILYQKAGLRNKAIEMWERSLAVAPDDATRQQIREHLLSLL
jgi:CheY-like chemotaxis protein